MGGPSVTFMFCIDLKLLKAVLTIVHRLTNEWQTYRCQMTLHIIEMSQTSNYMT